MILPISNKIKGMCLQIGSLFGAIGAFGYVISYGSSLKIDECYQKVDYISSVWNLTTPIIECNQAAAINNITYSLSIGLLIVSIILIAIAFVGGEHK